MAYILLYSRVPIQVLIYIVWLKYLNMGRLEWKTPTHINYSLFSCMKTYYENGNNFGLILELLWRIEMYRMCKFDQLMQSMICAVWSVLWAWFQWQCKFLGWYDSVKTRAWWRWLKLRAVTFVDRLLRGRAWVTGGVV